MGNLNDTDEFCRVLRLVTPKDQNFFKNPSYYFNIAKGATDPGVDYFDQ